jgi:hypothetical protein
MIIERTRDVPSVWGHNWATLFLEKINTGTLPSRLREFQNLMQYGYESHGTQTRERLRSRYPATTETTEPTSRRGWHPASTNP